MRQSENEKAADGDRGLSKHSLLGVEPREDNAQRPLFQPAVLSVSTVATRQAEAASVPVAQRFNLAALADHFGGRIAGGRAQ